MQSWKLYDERARVWVREYENGYRQRSVTPNGRSATPGASASGRVIHRGTHQLMSPIATPHGDWIAQTPSGRIATLNPVEYVSIRTPRVPQPPLSPHRVMTTHVTRDVQPSYTGHHGNSWLLAEPLPPPTAPQRHTAVHQAHRIDIVYDENASRLQSSRDRDIVEDSRRPGRSITHRTARERTELVEDPLRPGHFITLRALRQREDYVDDPQRPGNVISRVALGLRQDLVDDPRNPGHLVTRRALRQRGYLVDDPLNPGTMITHTTLNRRANTVEDPRRPGTFITRSALLSRERRQPNATLAYRYRCSINSECSARPRVAYFINQKRNTRCVQRILVRSIPLKSVRRVEPINLVFMPSAQLDYLQLNIFPSDERDLFKLEYAGKQTLELYIGQDHAQSLRNRLDRFEGTYRRDREIWIAAGTEMMEKPPKKNSALPSVFFVSAVWPGLHKTPENVLRYDLNQL
ncbi:hypothetical protein Q3G72_004696 [Acer saccharum]|nr:hypothetical protein Q3G72_004696 [Acer saccharum]